MPLEYMKEGASSVLLFILKPFVCSEHSNTEAIVLALPNIMNEETVTVFLNLRRGTISPSCRVCDFCLW